MATSREIVWKTIRFENPERIPYDLGGDYGSDFARTNMAPSVDARPQRQAAVDEWGAEWDNIGVSNLGEVVRPALPDWSGFDALNIPDVRDPKRWEALEGARERAGDQFLTGNGVSLYERVHFIRGLQNVWLDIHTERENLERLIDILVDMNLHAVERYAAAGVDAIMWCDDWGLQDRLMIDPDDWRAIWKPRYARVYQAAHDAGLATSLHSCGHIVSILDDLIDAGLDIIQMDQQENMGLDLLGERFGGRIVFWCPVDIQAVLPHATPDAIRAYARRMVDVLGRPEGGFMAKWYPDPTGAGHPAENVRAQNEAFLEIAGVEPPTTVDA